MNKSEVIRKFIDEKGIVDGKKLPNRTIARMVQEEYPLLFPTIENARKIVRLVTGANGDKTRKAFSDPEKTKYFDLDQWYSAYTDENQVWRTQFQIPIFDKLNIIADIHSVFVSKDALSTFFEKCENREALLINGDLLDSQSLTRHIKNKNMHRYDEEIEMVMQFLDYLKSEFDHVYFKEGNHDYWLERYIANRAPELGKLKGVDLAEILQLAGKGIHHIHNLQPIEYGDITICHGHEFPSGFSVPNRPAMSYLRKYLHHKREKVKLICSHVHQADQAVEKTYDGQYHYAWTTPAMCLKAAEYARFTRWDNGHTEITNGANGLEVNNIVYPVIKPKKKETVQKSKATVK